MVLVGDDNGRDDAVTDNRVSNAEGRKLICSKILEKSVQKSITDYLDALHIPYSITNAEASYDRNGNRRKRVETGWPDISGTYAGFSVYIETKRAVGGALSFIQADTLDRLYRQGALVCVPRSVDEVIELLKTKRTSAATIAEIVAALKKGPKVKRRGR
jgi:hypothetical protein